MYAIMVIIIEQLNDVFIMLMLKESPLSGTSVPFLCTIMVPIYGSL